MIELRLTHKVNIHKAAHSLAGKKKATDWTEDATEVAARISPIGDAPTTTLLGRGATETYQVYFAAGTDVEEGDKVIWLDRTPNRVFKVVTMEDHSGFDETQEDHLEGTMILQKAG